jgi:hypothetical protein
VTVVVAGEALASGAAPACAGHGDLDAGPGRGVGGRGVGLLVPRRPETSTSTVRPPLVSIVIVVP